MLRSSCFPFEFSARASSHYSTSVSSFPRRPSPASILNAFRASVLVFECVGCADALHKVLRHRIFRRRSIAFQSMYHFRILARIWRARPPAYAKPRLFSSMYSRTSEHLHPGRVAGVRLPFWQPALAHRSPPRPRPHTRILRSFWLRPPRTHSRCWHRRLWGVMR